MSNSNNPTQPLTLIQSLSPNEENRRTYRVYLRGLTSELLEGIVYGRDASQRWQSEYAMRELLNRDGISHLSDEEFEKAIDRTRHHYWNEHVRAEELERWREQLASGEFYRKKDAENREIHFSRTHYSSSTYKKKRDRRTHTIPDWVRKELRAEIRAARKTARDAGLDV